MCVLQRVKGDARDMKERGDKGGGREEIFFRGADNLCDVLYICYYSVLNSSEKN